MDFQAQLQQELNKMERNNNNKSDVVYPSNKLKHDELRFNKDNKEFTVRILPPKSGDEFFVYPAKEIFLNATNKNGKDLKLNAVLGYDQAPADSNLVRNLMEWQQQERVPNIYNRKANPTKKFYVNAVQVAPDQNGNMVMERDQQGNIMVRLLKLPQSAYQNLISKISDPMFLPQNAGEFGLIGEDNAYPVRITKPAPGGMSYTVDVFQKDLGPLQPNWRDFIEDLKYQATPSEEYNEEYVNYVIDVVNGVEGQNNGGGNSAPQAPVQGFQANQSNGGFGQPQQGFGQQQQAPQQNFNPPSQTQQANFNQAPQQQQGFNQAPQQNFNQPPATNQPVDFGDSGVFNNNMPSNFNNLPDVLPAQSAPQGTQAPQQDSQPQAQPTPPVATQSQQGSFGNVDDVLAQMQAMKSNLSN